MIWNFMSLLDEWNQKAYAEDDEMDVGSVVFNRVNTVVFLTGTMIKSFSK